MTTRRALAALAGFLLLAVAWTWPLAANLSARIPHDPGDPILNTWILWWNAQALPFTARWWDAPIFFPMAGALALSEHLAGIALVTTPLQWIGVGPLAAYNIVLILSFALSGFFAFLLGHRVAAATGAGLTPVLAGVCAGLAFGFAPYRASQLSHLQVLTAQWMPLALLALHGYVEDGRRRWLLIFAAAWLIQALSNGYYLLFLPILLVLWLAWFVDWRRAPRRGVVLVATWLGSSLLLVPSLLHYLRIHRALGLTRTIEEMQRFSARADSFVRPGGMLAFWPSRPALTQEEFLFPGVTALSLVLIAVVLLAARVRRPAVNRGAFAFYAITAVIMALLALGPAGESSTWIGHFKPYTLLTYLPGFSGLRAPARLAMLAYLCLATAASIAFAYLAPRRPLARAAFAAVVFAGLAVDGWMRPMPVAPAPGRLVLPNVANAVVVELPLDEGSVSTAAMYRAMLHGRPLVNGYSGHTPPHYDILGVAMRREDPSVLLELARGRPLVIAVQERHDTDGRFKRLVEGLPGIQAQGSTSAGAMYVLPAGPLQRQPPVGEELAIHSADTVDGHGLIDLGEPRTVRTLQFAVRWHFAELWDRLTIESSEDGQTWKPEWSDWTGAPALAGALENAREVPLRITLRDIRARYIRVSPARPWLTREVRLFAPR